MFAPRLHHVKSNLGFINWNVYRRPILEHRVLAIPLISTKNAGVCKTAPGGPHSVTYKAYVPPVPMDHDHKNMKMGRPMSPHLMIYEPTLPAMTSITQRATGVILSAYALALAAAPLFFSNSVDTYINMIQYLNLSEVTAIIIKAIIGWPFAYHYFIGIRFVIWNRAMMLDKKSVYTSAYLAILASAALAAFIAVTV